MRCQVIQSSARQCFGVWKVGDSSVGESWGGIYLEKCCRWCSVLGLGGFSPKMSLGQGFRCKWFIKEVLSEGIRRGMGEQDKEGAEAQRRSDLSSCTQPDLAGSSGTEITLQRLPPWIKGARLLCSHIISQSLAIGCPGESVKFPEWSSFGARGQSSKSHQCKLLAAKYRAGSGHTELVKGIQEAWGGVSESVTDAEYGIQQFYKGSTLTKNQWN